MSVYETSIPGQGNHWVIFKLIGTTSNKAAIGTKVEISIEEDGEIHTLHRKIGSGSSFGGNSLQLELGLGQATSIKKIKVIWAGSGTIQIFENIAIGQKYQLIEGVETLESVPYSAIPL